jgi:Sulfotransferase domain
VKLIGAGLPRTGTLTQKVALEMLGFGPCYHMVNVLSDLDQVPLWSEALAGRPDWTRILGGYESTVDWPSSFFYRDLMDVYPEAMVLLSVRDPARWERSMRETIWDTLAGDSVLHDLSSAASSVNPRLRAYTELMIDMWQRQGAFAAAGAGRLSDTLARHTEAVTRAVPPGRLLVWDVTEGWEPLCGFLDVDVPAAPLPHLNDSRMFRDRVVEMSLGMLNDWWQRQQL